jgi:hypothetical protein
VPWAAAADVIGLCHISEPEREMHMPRQNASTTGHDDGWLITPRALTSVATIVGLVYTLHAPVRYILHVGATVDALTVRVATLETVIDQQRSSIAAAERALLDRRSDAEPSLLPSPGPNVATHGASRSTATP